MATTKNDNATTPMATQPVEIPLRPVVQDQLTIGRIVHYVMPNGVHRPAIVVQVWDPANGRANLQVFTDGANDGVEYSRGLYWATSAQHSMTEEPGTWHWFRDGVCSAETALSPQVAVPTPTGSTTTSAAASTSAAEPAREA